MGISTLRTRDIVLFNCLALLQNIEPNTEMKAFSLESEAHISEQTRSKVDKSENS